MKEVQNLATGTADVGDALAQLSNTAKHLLDNVRGAEISRLEIVVKKGTSLGPNFQQSGDQLLKLNDVTGKFEPVRIQGKAVHIKQIVQPRVLPYNQVDRR